MTTTTEAELVETDDPEQITGQLALPMPAAADEPVWVVPG
jgi:hypothetical protein